jgi:hypothetical protein
MINYKYLVSFIFIALFVNYLILPDLGISKDIISLSCSQSDVQTAINSASNGDTVRVPSGSCDWTKTVSIPKDKGISLIGAGIDTTIISDATPTGYGTNLLNIKGSSGKPFRISGFTFSGGTGSEGTVFIEGDCKDMRIDHCKFSNMAVRAIWIQGYTYGVIDYNQFAGTTTYNCILVKESDGGYVSWATPLSLGSKNALYVENNNFNFSSGDAGAVATDCGGGGRVVVRYNIFKYITVGFHGTDSTSGIRSCFSYEVYNNTFQADSPVYMALGNIRGGTGVIFNNTFTGQFTIPIRITNYRTCSGYGAFCNGTWSGRCDGNDPLDGNSPGMQGYPCYDQIGRSTGQTLEPLYEWNNTFNGANAQIFVYLFDGCTNPSVSDHIKQGRDYYSDTPRPGYTSFPYPHQLAIPTAPSALKILP